MGQTDAQRRAEEAELGYAGEMLGIHKGYFPPVAPAYGFDGTSGHTRFFWRYLEVEGRAARVSIEKNPGTWRDYDLDLDTLALTGIDGANTRWYEDFPELLRAMAEHAGDE